MQPILHIPTNPRNPGLAMARRADRAVSRRSSEEVSGDGESDPSDALVTEAAVPRGRDAKVYQRTRGVRDWIETYRSAFPDLRVTVEEQVSEGEWVATRWTTRGTHEGELWGIPPTGKTFTISGVTVDRLVDGGLAEDLESWDARAMLEQLGVLEHMWREALGGGEG